MASAQTAASLRLLIDSRGAAAGAALFKKSTMMITLAVYAVVKTLADFEEKMTMVEKVAGASKDELAELTKKARDLGAVTRYTATEAADGLLQLSRAGFSVKESMLAVQDSLDLATAGGLAMGEATGFMSSSIRQFSLDASEAGRVAHTLTSVSNNTNTNIRQLAEALKYAGTVMATTGADIEETAAAIGILGNRGIQGSMAGTQLRGAFLALSAPTQRVHDGLAQLGLDYEKVNPATNTMVEIAENLAGGFKSLKNANDGAGIAVRIFGRRNMTAGITLADMVEKLKEQIALTKKTKDEHTELARAMEKTIIGRFKALLSVVQELFLALGDMGLNKVLKATLSFFVDLLRVVADVDGAWANMEESTVFLVKAMVNLGIAMLVIKRRMIFVAGAKAVTAIWAMVTGTWAWVTATWAQVAALTTLRTVMITTGLGALVVGLGLLANSFIDSTIETDKQAEAAKKLAKEAAEAAKAEALLAEETAKLESAFGINEDMLDSVAMDDYIIKTSILITDLEKVAQAQGDLNTVSEIYATIRTIQEDSEKTLTDLQKMKIANIFLEAKALEDLIKYKIELNDLEKTNVEYLETLKAENEVLALRAQGLNDQADVLEIINALKARDVDITTELGGAIFEARLAQLDLNDAVAEQLRLARELAKKDTKTGNRSDKKIESYLQDTAEELAMFELMKDNVNLSADAFELASEKAAIFAEAQVLLKDATAEQSIKILEARDAMIAYSDEMAAFEEQREMVLGVQGGIEDMFNSVIDGSKTAGEAFKDFIDNLIKDLLKAMAKKLIFDKLFGGGGFMGGMFGGGGGGGMGMDGGAGGGGGFNMAGGFAAQGKAFSHGNEVTKFATGGIVGAPTYFNTNQGMGLMGEAGAEAIMPLTRGKGGKLGVQSSGQGAKIVNVNMTVNTPDADSFRKSRIQIQNDMRRQTTNLTDDFK